MNDGGQEINHDDETHRETAETTEPVEEHQFAEIMYCGVDPATTLREKHLPVVRRDGVGMCISDKLSFEVRKVLEEEGGQVAIFAEVQEILHVERVNPVFGIVCH